MTDMQKRSAHTVLLGGIGGDSHSVGLTILRQALSLNGYRVQYLGTQNHLEDFLRVATLCNVVMISSMDGHTSYYLREFTELIKKYKIQGPLWYLGGNLHIGDAFGYESRFREMGFDRVFVKFVDVRTVLQNLERDLHGVEPKADFTNLWEQNRPLDIHSPATTDDGRLANSDFEAQRREVLEGWKTGHQARHLEENAEFLSGQPSWAEIQRQVNAGRLKPLIQPRSGVSGVNEQIELFSAFKSAGAHVLSYQVDSLTRNNNYAGVEEAIREGQATGGSTLNGFPVINHGVQGLRRIISEVKLPLQTRHSTRDPRLLAEISYAGGVTAFEGGAICYNIPYYKNYPLDASIKAWQYVDRLTGLYYERFGISLDREFFGTLTATLIPPCLAIVVNIIESILAVQQGVKCLSLGYAEQGNRAQDIAAIRMLRELTGDVIGNMGYKDVHLSTVFHQYMAAFPPTPQHSEELIYNSAVTMALSGATRVLIKTPAESVKIPTLKDNVHGINLVRRGMADAEYIVVDEARISFESAIIRREVRAILDSVILCGRGSISEGIVTGFRQGYLDIPFSPSSYNRNEVITARDSDGAVRFLSCGNLQFDRELRQFHEEIMAERRRGEDFLSEQQNYLLVEQDVMRIPRGEYRHWPLDKSSAGAKTLLADLQHDHALSDALALN
jgi:methylaspartate mutase epsilon subunit